MAKLKKMYSDELLSKIDFPQISADSDILRFYSTAHEIITFYLLLYPNLES